MKFDMTHALVGIAVFAIAYHLGQKRAGAATTTPAIDNPPVGWAYPGSWGGGF